MMKPMYAPVNGTMREIKKPYGGVDNISRKAIYGYVGVDNVARKCFSSVMPVGELEVGSSIFIEVDGSSTEFLVVHQGLPDVSFYDSSCDGTWLMSKILFDNMKYNSASCNGYHLSAIHTYASTTFLNLVDANVQSIIKEVKIPYLTANSAYTTLKYGADGLSTKCFSLAAREVGLTSSDISGLKEDGVPLDYFSDEATAASRRIAYYGDGTTGSGWWLRACTSQTICIAIGGSGGAAQIYYTGTRGIRPTFILPSETLVDDNFNIIIR